MLRIAGSDIDSNVLSRGVFEIKIQTGFIQHNVNDNIYNNEINTKRTQNFSYA